VDAPNKDVITLMAPHELEKMRAVGVLAAQLLDHVARLVRPGVTTQFLNDEAEKWTAARGLRNAPLGYSGAGSIPFPRSLCTSVNDVVCHGIPSPRTVLKNGDIVNIDVTPVLDGYHGDTSKTFLVGEVSPVAQKLVTVTEECLWRGIRAVKAGVRVGDIGAAIQEHAESQGFSVVREFVGHGVGRLFHTAPQIPHFGVRGKGLRLQAGMVFTIEPMINAGEADTEMLEDGWTAVTADGSLSAQFEHTVAVTSDGCQVLTLGEGCRPG
jgi:methionyl aminopeptidase